MPQKVKIDRDLCIGCGTCLVMCPKVFKLDEEGKSTVIKKDGSTTRDWATDAEVDDMPENIKNAADGCPTRAILIEE